GEDVRVIVVGVAGVGNGEVARGVHGHVGVGLPERAGADLHDVGQRDAVGIEPPGHDVGVATGLGLPPGHREVAVGVHGHGGIAVVEAAETDGDLRAPRGPVGVVDLGADVVVGAGEGVGPDDDRHAVGGAGVVRFELGVAGGGVDQGLRAERHQLAALA